MNQPNTPQSLPEDEDMDPVGKPYPEQEKEKEAEQQQSTPEDGDDPPHPPFSPSNEPDIAPQ